MRDVDDLVALARGVADVDRVRDLHVIGRRGGLRHSGSALARLGAGRVKRFNPGLATVNCTEKIR